MNNGSLEFERLLILANIKEQDRHRREGSPIRGHLNLPCTYGNLHILNDNSNNNIKIKKEKDINGNINNNIPPLESGLHDNSNINIKIKKQKDINGNGNKWLIKQNWRKRMINHQYLLKGFDWRYSFHQNYVMKKLYLKLPELLELHPMKFKKEIQEILDGLCDFKQSLINEENGYFKKMSFNNVC